MSVLPDLVETGNGIEILRELLARGENPDGRNGVGRSALHIAVMKCERNPQDIDEILLVVRELISSGANVNLRDCMGYTPLHLAAMSRNYEMIEIFLQANADINQKDYDGWAVLHYATTKRPIFREEAIFPYDTHFGVVKLLLRHNPNIDTRNQWDETPLMLAARNSNLYIVRELLKKNATVNLQDSSGDTAMHYALSIPEVNLGVVFELARHGSSLFTTNYYGETPLDYYFQTLPFSHPRAEVEKAKQVIKLFILRGYHFNDKEKSCIREISKQNKICKLPRFLNFCYKEILKMKQDILTPKYNVYDIALRGAYSKTFADKDHIPVKVFDRVLDKLIGQQYIAYCDVIAACVCRPYMRNKFAEICSNVETGIKFSDLNELYLVSFYLSHLDMLNMMIACSGEERHSWVFARCSIS